MRTFHFITSFLFGAIILLMAGAAIVRAVPYDVPEDARLADGSLTRAFESHYDKVFPVKTFGTNLWGAIQFALFGEGRAGVVVGREGWLYTSEEFGVSSDAEQQVQAHLDLIADVQRRLREQGTELTVALLPAKVRLYPEYLPEERPAALHRDLYMRVQHGLQQRGVRAPDLLTPMTRCKAQEAVFLRTDTHWTPDGAACTAQALAAAKAVPVEGDSAYLTEIGAPRTHQGDLMQFLPLAPYFAALLPQPDVLVVRSTQSQSGGDLFGDAPAPRVALIGTSYSADARWNFDGALRQNLGQDVLNLARAGHGPFEPMLAYLDQPRGAEPAPAHLIWEIPERYVPASTYQRKKKEAGPAGHEQLAMDSTPQQIAHP